MSVNAFVGDAAATHGECIVCLEPRSLRLAVLCDARGQRACRHFLCVDCGNSLERMLCPICRAAFVRVVQLPSPHRDPRQLFRLLDVSGDGRISKQELGEYCAAFVGVDIGTIGEEIDKRWASWDADADGTIDYLEFVSGVCPMLEEVYEREHRRARVAATQIPSIWEEPDRWFAHFDEDKTGSLDPGELLRALSKTFGGLSTVELTGVLEAVWPLVDIDGSGSIDLEEFAAPNGLRDLLRANLPDTTPRQRLPTHEPTAMPPPRPVSMERGAPPPYSAPPPAAAPTGSLPPAPRDNAFSYSGVRRRWRLAMAAAARALPREQLLQLVFALCGVGVGIALMHLMK